MLKDVSFGLIRVEFVRVGLEALFDAADVSVVDDHLLENVLFRVVLRYN